MSAAASEISDSTDWLNTPVSSLAPLEAGLRCEICKDFFTAPVITACFHTFCSGCIRRSLSSVNASRKCPLCWAPFDEGQLRKNKVVEELVKTFQVARPEILKLGQNARNGAFNGAERSRKRKIDELENMPEVSNGPSPRKTRSQTQQRTRIASDSVEPDEEAEETEQQRIGHSEAAAHINVDDGKVSCPICQQRMPEAQVFTHLDSHSDDKPVISPPAFGLPTRNQSATTPTMTPLPTLSYNLMNDIQMRKKLRELGIPADGNKQIMSRRHTEWRNLVNANCDSSRPMSKSELLRELNQWERTQNSSSLSSLTKTSKAAVMEKDFDRDEWSISHNSDFQSLIAAAKAKAKTKLPPMADAQVDGEENQLPVQILSDERPVQPALDMPLSSQTHIVNLVSPEKMPTSNGFHVP